ncbi:MAG TPA: hypothetical protein VHQ65_00530 [Thermoanaerobaculia bacterium]|nr:hypothetical protein [Thermoanaerobaculia bacterium]
MRALVLILLLVPTGADAAEIWSFGECRSELARERTEFRRQLRNAQPDDPMFVPFPFPRNEHEAVADLIAFHRKAFADLPDNQLAPGNRRFFATLDEGRARFEVARVANWTPSRCGRRSASDFFYLVRVFDTSTGEEISRGAVDNWGLTMALAHVAGEAGGFRALPRLTVARGASVTSPQFVHTVGQELHCEILWPCIAYREGANAFIVRDGETYRLALERPLLSFRQELGNPQARRQLLDRFTGTPETFVTLGGDRVAVAEPVAPH